MTTRDIIVVGASAGGVTSLSDLVAALPRDLPVSMFVTVHVPPHRKSVLPEILSRPKTLQAKHAEDGERVERGWIYVAPPDQHLLLKGDRIRLTRGPQENHNRPAIDPLFRSAAQEYGERVLGVVLSGFLDDGTAGLMAIKQLGGAVAVQTLDEAPFPDMPRSAMQHVATDCVGTVKEIAEFITSGAGVASAAGGSMEQDEQSREQKA